MNTGKNILNINKNIEKISIISDNDRINISIDKAHLSTLSPFEVNKILLTALSPLMLNDFIQIKNSSITNKSFKHIVFFIEQMPHYTGGRYSIFHQALLLSHFTRVTVVSNIKPKFFNDFSDYFSDNFNFIENPLYLSLESNNNLNADLVVGCPVVGGIYAHEYAKKFNLPLYLIMFESPNWISKFRDGADSDEAFWTSYKKCLLESDKIMVPSHESKLHLLKWLKVDGRDVDVIYPCINEVVANKVKLEQKCKKNIDGARKNLIFITRMIPAKSPLSMIKKLDKNKFSFTLIGKIWTDQKNIIDKLIEDGYLINICGSMNDYEKFKLINDSDIMIFPTKFEGFGMPPMEALYFNKPVIAYDLPVLREIYGDKINYVENGNIEQFVEKINEISNKDEIKYFNNRIEYNNISPMRQCCEKLLKTFEIPKISVGMIVYNGSDYIEHSIKSIYNVVSEIIIVDGVIKKYNGDNPLSYENCHSDDGTLDIIKKLKEMDVCGKIKFIPSHNKPWESEIIKRNEIAKNITGDYYVLIDHDEIWKPETLLDAIKYMELNKHIHILRMKFYHFWLSFKNIACDEGGKWSTIHPRIWRWNKDFKHVKSFNYFQDNKNTKVGEPFYCESIYDGDRIYHFGYARKSKNLLQKIEYYKNRGIENCGIDTVTPWKELSDTTQPTQIGVKSWAEKFNGELPEILKTHEFYGVDDIRNF